MGRTYTQLDQSMRDRIKVLKDDGYSARKIGQTLGIHHTTVSREIKRNSYGNDGRTVPPQHDTYDSSAAQHKAYVRRKYAKYQGKKINEDQKLRAFIISKLKAHYSPDEISGMMKNNPRLGFYASKTAIYEWLRTGFGAKYACHLYSGRDTVRRRNRKGKTKRVMIQDRLGIEQRPRSVLDRHELGHGEFDSIVSSKTSGNTAALAVVIERSTRLVRVQLVPNLKPQGYANTIAQLCDGLTIRSLTTDNGIENRHHKQVTKQTGAKVYFTDPYSSWQKGAVEHANKMIRRYFPKGTDFATIT